LERKPVYISHIPPSPSWVPLVFFLTSSGTEPLDMDNWHQFLWARCLPVCHPMRQTTLSQHWRKLSALTPPREN